MLSLNCSLQSYQEVWPCCSPAWDLYCHTGEPLRPETPDATSLRMGRGHSNSHLYSTPRQRSCSRQALLPQPSYSLGLHSTIEGWMVDTHP